jgi:hypothetical protein
LRAQIPVYQEIERISLGARQLPAGPHMAAFASIVDGVITRALTTRDATPVILEDAQRELKSRGIQFL